MTIIFDFDYTLYNTDRLKKALYSVAGRAGVSLEVFELTLPVAFGGTYSKMGYGGAYSARRHCELIGRYVDCDSELLHCFFLQAIKQSDLYLYNDISVLEKLKKRGHNLVLLTFGNKEFQSAKVEASGIGEYFGEIIYVEEMNSKHLALPVENDEEFVFVNDNVSENEKVQESYLHARVFQMVRPNAHYDVNGSQEVIHSLHDLVERLNA